MTTNESEQNSVFKDRALVLKGIFKDVAQDFGVSDVSERSLHFLLGATTDDRLSGDTVTRIKNYLKSVGISSNGAIKQNNRDQHLFGLMGVDFL